MDNPHQSLNLNIPINLSDTCTTPTNWFKAIECFHKYALLWLSLSVSKFHQPYKDLLYIYIFAI